MRSILSLPRTALGLALWLVAAPASAQPLVADLSQHLVAVTTGFVGTEVILFGATEGVGDVVMVLRGPERDYVVRRKDRVAGIWVNRKSATFNTVPSFYYTASNRPLDEILTPSARARHGIGVDVLRLEPETELAPEEETTFRRAFVRNQQRRAHYAVETGQVSFLGERLFRTTLFFPASVPTGVYTVEVFLVDNGDVVSAQTTPLVVSKVGVGAEIFEFAHRQSALYGILAVIVAVVAGWLAGVVFRKA